MNYSPIDIRNAQERVQSRRILAGVNKAHGHHEGLPSATQVANALQPRRPYRPGHPAGGWRVDKPLWWGETDREFTGGDDFVPGGRNGIGQRVGEYTAEPPESPTGDGIFLASAVAGGAYRGDRRRVLFRGTWRGRRAWLRRRVRRLLPR